jgi:Flp pilus assembly CpaE family ATPase
MSERPTVVLALTPVAEQAIEPLLFGPQAALEPRVSVAEADELEAEAAAVDARAVLLSPALSGLTPGHCARVRARGLRLIGVALDERERDALLDLAVDEIIAADDNAALIAAVTGTTPATPGGVAHAAGSDERTSRDGSVVAVIGSKGSPGSSELAGSLAALASQQWPCALVELDLLGGALDLRLGATAQRGSLLALLHAAENGTAGVRELLEHWLVTAKGWPPVLLGPTDPVAAAGELAQPGAVAAALRAIAAVYPLCILDTGFLLGDERELTATGRVHRDALIAADAVILVLGAREQQLRAGFETLDLLLDQLDLKPERLRVVLNGYRGPGSSDHSLEATLQRRLGERGLALDARLRWDRRALARTQRNGLPLAAASPRGPYAKALRRLLDEVFLPTTPAPRGRKRRLVVPTEKRPPREEVALPWRS